MPHSRKPFPTLLSLLLLASCVAHNAPGSLQPNRMEAPRTAVAFVDQNGTFYPSYWKERYGAPPSAMGSAYSLLTIAGWDGDTAVASLRAQEQRSLDELEAFLRPKERVFILIHGFNSSMDRSDRAYERIENSIAFTESDAVLEFHWDGLVARGGPLSKPLGSGKIWFNAAGYSQLAGARGLRQILNRLHNKDIVIIAHSRGASVALSAFADPPYNETFRSETQEFHNIDVYANQPLQADNRNRITAVFLAPAIGAVDFRTIDCTAYRQFDPQVVRIHHTVNRNDPVLRKFVGLSDTFNPTNLGYNAEVTAEVAGGYGEGFLTSEPFHGLGAHDFELYVSDPRFKQMLRSLGINVTQ
jgi:pimeloyl-ACP methyl ester carboxylesterase